MIIVRTAAETIAPGERVTVGVDGLVRVDVAGKLEAYGPGAPGYLMTLGSPRPAMIDTPSRVVYVTRDGAELGVNGGRRS